MEQHPANVVEARHVHLHIHSAVNLAHPGEGFDQKLQRRLILVPNYAAAAWHRVRLIFEVE